MVNSIDDQRINIVNETPIKQMAHGNAARIIPFLKNLDDLSLYLVYLETFQYCSSVNVVLVWDNIFQSFSNLNNRYFIWEKLL